MKWTIKATKKAQEIEKQALKRSRTRELNLLGEKLEEGQLVFWPETERGVPNELVRCAVFGARTDAKRGAYSERTGQCVSLCWVAAR